MAESAAKLIRDKKNFIKIEPNGIHWGYHSHFLIEKDGMYSWYIPSFDIYYSSETLEKGNEIGTDATKAFFEFWLKKQGFRKFVSKILRLGYKPASFTELKSLLDRRNINANLTGSPYRIPKSFEDATIQEQFGSLETAV